VTSGTLDICATVGSLLLPARDVPGAARALEHYFLHPEPENASLLRHFGIDEALTRDLASVLPTEDHEIARVCELGTAWALGRQSVTSPPTWEPVVTSGDITEQGVDRMTAETLIGLIVGARRTVRLFSAYVDQGGLDVVAVSLSAATRRGVTVMVGYAVAGDKHAAVTPFTQRLEDTGDSTKFRVVGIGVGRAFPHVKLLAVDGLRAYIGSANLTWPALTSNAEFGALVSGHHVVTLERYFDALLDPPTEQMEAK
jgi:phosphatidylserine/phosphatidylglycerophosphate/cardiolipin synthase-like enzyme